MNSEIDINQKILKITMAIKDNYPELSKYLNEMPVTLPVENHPEIDQKNLEKYYDSLVNLFRNYVAEHQLTNCNRNSDNHHL